MTTATMTEPTRYIIVPAPGYYGDVARVISSHRTYDLAARAAGRDPSIRIRAGSLARGDRWLRSVEASYPDVDARFDS